MSTKNDTYDSLSKGLVVLAVLLALFALFSPLIFTRGGTVNFTETGQIGDTIGGITAPFIGLASIIVMFLAFYIQLKANKMMQRQFDRNKFENQFFQMLKTHKENSNVIINDDPIGGFETLVAKTKDEYYGFLYAYTISTDGIDLRLERFREIYRNKIWRDSFGHYYRHLFLMVKFVVRNQELIYEEKRDYLRILRASLSTSEQVFLYYNWLSGYGKQWQDEKNSFFTDYRMIHNVNDAILPDFDVEKMSPFKELLEKKTYRREKDANGREREDDDLFEFEQTTIT